MIEHFDIAGYCRISVDDELDRDNVSIENQKAIIKDYVNQRFPGSTLTFMKTGTVPAIPSFSGRGISPCAGDLSATSMTFWW